MFNFMTYSKSRSRGLSILLLLWVYTYALFYFVPLIIPSNTMLMYIWLLAIDILVVLNYKNISIKLLGFLMTYTFVALINIVFVSYKYYAAIEAFSGLAVFLPALLIINSSQFDLKDFLITWNKVAVIVTILSPIAIILMQHHIIDYGVFTYLNLPNSIIFSYVILSQDKNGVTKKAALLLAFINFLIILFFGGRMAAFVAAFSVFVGYMISSSVNRKKKVASIIFIGVTGIFIIRNLNIILLCIQIILKKYNLSSRSLTLLIEQMGSSGTGLYMTRRDVIYAEIVDYIFERWGLPGGFGVSLSLSDGQFYHPHNFFLQLAVLFGIIGSILFILLAIYRIVKIKNTFLRFEYQFTLIIVLDYLALSITGGSILNNYIAIMGIGMIFFYRGKQQTIATA